MASIIGAAREPQPLARIDQHASAPAVKWTALDRREFVAFIAAIFFVYIGTESGIGGWVTTYAKRLYLFPAGSIGFAQSTFYGALLIGRLAAPFILRKMKGRNLVLLSLGVSAAGLALSVTALQAAAVLAGLFIAGIGFAAVFPTTVATFSDRLGADAIRLSAWIFPLGYIGAAVIPFVMGAASEKFHALRYGMIAALVFILIMIALQMQIIRILRRESPAAGCAGADPPGQRRRAGPQPDDEAVGEGGAHDRIEHHPSGGGQHAWRVGAQHLQHDIRFEVPVGGFAALLPELPDGLAHARGDDSIHVDERPSGALRHERAHGRLSRPHEAHEHDGFHRPTLKAWRAKL